MKKLVIYRCLPFKDWHQPFDKDGSRWLIGGYRQECSCPYGSHWDPRFLDYKDPLNLKEILSMQEGIKLLTFYSWKDEEYVAFHTFKNVEFYSDFMRILFKEKVDVCEYGGTGEQLTGTRLIAVIEDAGEINAFGKIGGIDEFIDELSKLTGISIQEIKQQINELDETPIPSELKISIEEITEEAKRSGNLAPIFG
ncbi:MAG: hypothetical protein WCW54_00710 [Candidatus Paceibacterota bacterium]